MSNDEKDVMEELEVRLRTVRGHLAHSFQCSPYLIFSDKEIPLLLERKPKNIHALSEISGFPANGKRVQKWGQKICDVFNPAIKIKGLATF